MVTPEIQGLRRSNRPDTCKDKGSERARRQIKTKHLNEPKRETQNGCHAQHRTRQFQKGSHNNEMDRAGCRSQPDLAAPCANGDAEMQQEPRKNKNRSKQNQQPQKTFETHPRRPWKHNARKAKTKNMSNLLNAKIRRNIHAHDNPDPGSPNAPPHAKIIQEQRLGVLCI